MSMQSNIERGRSWIAGAAQKFRRLFSGLAGAGLGRAQRAQRNPCRPMMPFTGTPWKKHRKNRFPPVILPHGLPRG